MEREGEEKEKEMAGEFRNVVYMYQLPKTM